jgi:hypothetical protein
LGEGREVEEGGVVEAAEVLADLGAVQEDVRRRFPTYETYLTGVIQDDCNTTKFYFEI